MAGEDPTIRKLLREVADGEAGDPPETFGDLVVMLYEILQQQVADGKDIGMTPSTARILTMSVLRPEHILDTLAVLTRIFGEFDPLVEFEVRADEDDAVTVLTDHHAGTTRMTFGKGGSGTFRLSVQRRPRTPKRPRRS